MLKVKMELSPLNCIIFPNKASLDWLGWFEVGEGKQAHIWSGDDDDDDDFVPRVSNFSTVAALLYATKLFLESSSPPLLGTFITSIPAASLPYFLWFAKLLSCFLLNSPAQPDKARPQHSSFFPPDQLCIHSL